MKKLKGVTLLETILVLTLISIIMIGGIKLYDNASSNAKVNESIREMSMIVNNVRAFCNGKNCFGLGWDSDFMEYETIEDMGIVGDLKFDRNGELPNSLGATYFIEAYSNWFRVDIYALNDKKICYKVLSKAKSIGATNIQSYTMSDISTICNVSGPVDVSFAYDYY